MKMKLLLFIVFLIISVSVKARRDKKAKYYRQNRNDTQVPNMNVSSLTIPLDISGELRKSFYLFCAESKPQSNTLCSPISALLPLAKLALGAEDESLNELLNAIGVSRKSKIGDYFKLLLTRLRYLPGVKLDIASKLYVSQKAHLNRAFRDSARDIFQSSVDKIDFTFPTYATEQINTWVSSQTNGLIKDILQPSDIPQFSSMVLVNAVYFNVLTYEIDGFRTAPLITNYSLGRWLVPFEKVKNVTFHSPTSHRNIEMMTLEGEFNYTHSEALGARVISIPYTGGVASMVVVCPMARGGLAALLAALRLAGDTLSAVLGSATTKRVKLTMPKFKVHDDLDLTQAYSKIGLKTIFDQKKSGLKKIVRDETVYVTSAKHKCFIDVNEYGTEAAASSAMAMAKLSLEKPIEFLVDHPFLYFILVNDQQLFAGTFVNPESHVYF